MAKDKLHNHIKRILTKNGYTITRDPLNVKHESLRFFIDLEATRDGELYAIEIKSFNSSFLAEFYKTLGQVLVYGRCLKLRKMKHRLFVAIDKRIWRTYFQEHVPQLILKRYHLAIIAIDFDNDSLEIFAY